MANLPLCVRLPIDDTVSAKALKADGWRDVEILDMWFRTGHLDRLTKPQFPPETIFRRCEGKYVEIVARVSAEHDQHRLAKDPLVDEVTAVAARAAWLRKAFRRADSLAVVAVLRHCIAGFLVIEPRQPTLWRIVFIQVTRGFHGKGIAKAMLWHLFRGLPRHCRIVAGTQRSNRVARRFYRSLGFEVRRSYRTFHKP